jgi:hypothetical protein
MSTAALPLPRRSSRLERVLATALFGLFLPFLVAFSAAAAYYCADRRWLPFLLRQILLSGTFYGVGFYFFTDRIVVPLPAPRKHPFTMLAGQLFE